MGHHGATERARGELESERDLARAEYERLSREFKDCAAPGADDRAKIDAASARYSQALRRLGESDRAEQSENEG